MEKREGLRFDWYGIADADFIDELAATVTDTVNEKRSTRGLTPDKATARAEEERFIAKHLIGSLSIMRTQASLQSAHQHQ